MNADIKLREDQKAFIEAHNKYLEHGGDDALIDFDKVICCECCGTVDKTDLFDIYIGSVGVCKHCASPSSLQAFQLRHAKSGFRYFGVGSPG